MQDFSRLGFLRAYVAIFTRSAELADAATRDDRETFGVAILDITRAIYASTPTTQKKLRDIVVRTIQRSMELGEVSRRSLSMKHVCSLITEQPDLGHDLAIRRLAPRKWKCSSCKQEDFVLVTFCGDGNWDCRDEACELGTVSRNYCKVCTAFDVLRRPKASANST